METTEALPDIAQVLGEIMQTIDAPDRPLLLALLERLAAKRYLVWADEASDEDTRAGLTACAEREQQIAERVESAFPEAATIQARLLSDNPELETLNRTLFEGRPLIDQYTMQAAGERAGGAAWSGFAAVSEDPRARGILESCTALELANAEFLETLITA
jgi:hypothetical protein